MSQEDRRTSPRLPVDQDVVLTCHELGFVKGRVLDLSRNGAYVQTGLISVFAHATIGICFVLTDQQNRELVKLDAKVVRTTEDGIGLLFTNTSEALLKRFSFH